MDNKFFHNGKNSGRDKITKGNYKHEINKKTNGHNVIQSKDM